MARPVERYRLSRPGPYAFQLGVAHESRSATLHGIRLGTACSADWPASAAMARRMDLRRDVEKSAPAPGGRRAVASGGRTAFARLARLERRFAAASP
jgi:hypothetical protein